MRIIHLATNELARTSNQQLATDPKKHQKLRNELARTIRTELSYRSTAQKRGKNIIAINEEIEKRNRQIVEAHQREETESILPAIFLGRLQLKEGGKLHIETDGLRREHAAAYENKRYRYDTLYTAALMAMKDAILRETVFEYERNFDLLYGRLTSLLQLIERVGQLQKAAKKVMPEVHGDEAAAYTKLEELAPIRAEIRNIDSQCAEYQKERYLRDAVYQLQGAIQSARRTLSDRSRKAARVLFNQASSIYHTFRGTEATLPNIEQFISQKESLERYLTIFENAGDKERKGRIEAYISDIDGTIERVRTDVQRQKEDETRAVEKQRKTVQETYDRFQDIKEMFARGEIKSENQLKKTGEKLRFYRDTLIANGHRIMAEEVERFINSTGIGKVEPPQSKDGEKPFDFKKGFYILLPITILLTFLTLILLIS